MTEDERGMNLEGNTALSIYNKLILDGVKRLKYIAKYN